MAIDLAVASAGPTRRRLRRNLPAHGIAVHALEVGGRLYELGDLSPGGAPSYDVGFVFPSRVPEGDVVAAALGIPWVNGREDILSTRYKAAALARLAGAGLPIPRTVCVSTPTDEADLVAAFRSFEGPVVVKPNSATRGRGHVLVDDVDSFRGVVDYFDLIHAFPATEDRSFLLQRYVPDARDCRLTLVDGRVAGAVERRRSDGDGWVQNVHRGAEAVAIDPPAELVDLAERAAAVIDVPLLGVDVLVGQAGATVLEVNARPTVDRAEKYPSDFYDRLAGLIERTAGVSRSR